MRFLVLSLFLVFANGYVWDNFKAEFGRQYEDVSIESHAKMCFMRNLKFIEERNALGLERHGVNQFTDLCPEEFARMYLTLKVNNIVPGKQVPPFSAEAVTATLTKQDTIDWRTKGAVTPIKNQAQCGSCWAFSSTGNMEGQWFLAGHPMVSLSEQELVSCSHNGNQGCNGGLMDQAFDWVVQNGITSEANYPYTSGGGVSGTCKQDKIQNPVANITGKVDVPKDEKQMATWLAQNGPLSIAVDASSGWQTYHGGVLTTCTGRTLDHGVLAVGYNADYWIVKNSWGPTWGEQGYIRLQMGTNQCGINMMPSSSIASTGPPPPPLPTPSPQPTPPPVPACDTTKSFFTQKQCGSDQRCMTGCSSRQTPTGSCIGDTDGGGFIPCCSADGKNLVEKVYDSPDCSDDTFTVKLRPLNTCVQSNDGSLWFMDTCNATLWKALH